MKKVQLTPLIFLTSFLFVHAQEIIPLDTTHWDIKANAYLFETYRGKQAIYLKGGTMRLKEQTFQNGTLEFDIFLKESRSFPGVTFRIHEDREAEIFYLRPHLPGKPDATQAIPAIGGLSAWQLYFGPKYSFPYEYRYDDWTHVKLVVEDNRAQVFLDYSEIPQHSWYLTHPERAGGILFSGGNDEAMHLADIRIDPDAHSLRDFNPVERQPIPGLISEWEVSDKFEESMLEDISGFPSLLSSRKWIGKIAVEEGTAANISRRVVRYDDEPGNTVFARIRIRSEEAGLRLFQFGYSDRVLVVLNGTPLYRGNNNFMSRDYRYLGTVGLFDEVYLNLKKGDNILLMAVSEDFGGWLITGKFSDDSGIKIVN